MHAVTCARGRVVWRSFAAAAAVGAALHGQPLAAQLPGVSDAGTAGKQETEPAGLPDAAVPELLQAGSASEPAPASAPASGDEPELIVTGSRIKRSASLAASAPVEV